ncbi:MAG: hypothetical protein OEZ20_00020 [candidate division WOR-3 bacterium]|nr:hypothetical protein [candidate division WOR-3 bacterium]
MLFPKLKTGFNLIDDLWQGFFKGRTYLLSGPVDSGKTTFALQYALKGLASKEKIVFFSDERPEDVLLRAEALQLGSTKKACFDLTAGFENGDFLIFNIGLDDKTKIITDQLLNQTSHEISQIVEKEQPVRLIFDQITFLLQYKEFETLKQDIKELIYSFEKSKVTNLITIGEPASNQAEKILDFLSSLATATIKLSEPENEKRRLQLHARLGHYPDSYSSQFVIRPGIGLTTIEKVVPITLEQEVVPEITPEPTWQEPEPAVSPEPSVTETPVVEPVAPQPVEPIFPEPAPEAEAKPSEVSDRIEPIESIPEYPVRDLDRDDFTGLFNFDGLLNIISREVEKKTPFSLMIISITKGVDSRAKRLLLSHKLASAVKSAISKPAPVGRYSDKIIAYLHKTPKLESQEMATIVENKTLKTLIAENESLKGIEIRVDIYAYPEDILSIREIETIVQAGGEQ